MTNFFQKLFTFCFLTFCSAVFGQSSIENKRETERLRQIERMLGNSSQSIDGDSRTGVSNHRLYINDISEYFQSRMIFNENIPANIRSEIKLKIDTYGNILEYKLTKSSGFDSFDVSALEAVSRVNKIPDRLKNYISRELVIIITSEYGSNKQRSPFIINCPNVNYPHASRLNGEEGLVILGFNISSNLIVSDVEVIKSSGFDALDLAAKELLVNCRFELRFRYLHPSNFKLRLPVKFILD